MRPLILAISVVGVIAAGHSQGPLPSIGNVLDSRRGTDERRGLIYRNQYSNHEDDYYYGDSSGDDYYGYSDDDDGSGHAGYYGYSEDDDDDDEYTEEGWGSDASHTEATLQEHNDYEDYPKVGVNHSTELCYASCEGDECTYHMKVDLFASEFGVIIFEECEDAGYFPTISMEIGKRYRFIQSDISNYVHPIGFGYYPDPPHMGLEEYEFDSVNPPPGSNDSCASDESCPTVDYKLNGQGIDLEQYEHYFAHPLGAWVSYGTFSAELAFPRITGFKQDIFYWCHIHGGMGGRIKLLKNGIIINKPNYPTHVIDFAPPSSYDRECGTYYLEDFQLPNAECPHRFVCNIDSSGTSFASCLESMNCHMFAGMTTYANQGDRALFLHQMIPHHQNAVNMAKSLLLKWGETCDDLSGADESDVCIIEDLLRSIINSQNAQIQSFRNLLSNNGWTEFDDCPVKMSSNEDPMSHGDSGSNYEHKYPDDDFMTVIGDDSHNESDDELLKNASNYDEAMSWETYINEDDKYTGSIRKTQVIESPKNNDAGSFGSRKFSDSEVRVSRTDRICKISCGGDVCEINVEVDIFATRLGAFKFNECGDEAYPTIGLEMGKTYRFVQKARNNYYHPLGFAYFADGNHDGKEEVEDQYLRYKIDNQEVGLDGYEPKFFLSLEEWTEFGTFNVELTVNMDHDEDLFYFCHIHQYMSGRIKILSNGEPINIQNIPAMPYMHEYISSAFDENCGTTFLGDFQLPNPECPHKFVCDNSPSNFASCLEAMNCAMMVGMTTYVEDVYEGDIALFNHQMIPHHENAVNMAKSLLHEGILDCPDIMAETDDCELEEILWEIVSNQNYQIQIMQGLLERKGFPEFNDCVVTHTSGNNPHFV